MAEIWPPAAHRPRLDAIRKNRAWYSGDDLAGSSGESFWSKRSTSKEDWSSSGFDDDDKVHVMIAADLALTASDFLFGGGVEFLAPDAGQQARLNEANETAGVLGLLPLAGERASGLGEIYIRLGWDAERPLCTIVDPDRVLPSFRWGRLVGATVWSDLPDHDGKRWRHLEIYEPGVIRHELWLRGPDREAQNPAGSKTKVDEMETIRPLSDHPETAAILAGMSDEDADLGRVRLPEALDGRLALLYVGNAEPRTPRPGGRADTEGQEPFMAGLDRSWSSLLRDVDLSKLRVLVDESMLTRNTPALSGARFDKDARVFSALAGGGMSTKELLQIVQGDIRAVAHLATISELIHRIVSTAGYSPESLSVVQGGLPEAAAARRARERASLRTTERKAAQWRPVIAEALSSLAVIAADLDDEEIEPPAVSVTLRSALSPDTIELSTAVAAAFAVGIMSPTTAVRELHPHWTKKQVEDEVAQLPPPRNPQDNGGV